MILYHILCFDNKKFCNHNMAGGFDGMEVTHALTHVASHPQLKQV